jgi:multimeric flavodoxin WrbA
LGSNVIAINSSPRMEKGNTAVLLAPFLDGMREAGAEVELVYAHTLEIEPCEGDYACWVKTAGSCIHSDDMEQLLPKVASADILVLATPLYVDGMTGTMKTLLDRIIPIVRPEFELRDGHCRHPARRERRDWKVVLVSNCGFWEADNFDPLVAHVKAVCRNLDAEFAGALLRPHGPALKAMLDRGMAVDDVLAAAKEAGRQLEQNGEMSAETLRTVSRALLPLPMYVDIVNQNFRKAKEGV